MAKLIGITGFKMSGKDSSADYLIQHHGFIKYSFASPLKNGVKAFFNWSEHQLHDTVLKEMIDPFYGVSPREVLQWFGTEVMREMLPTRFSELGTKIGSNFWVERFKQFYTQNKNSNIVISDLRFQNEVDTIKSLGGMIIKVNRRLVKPKVISHPSEDIDMLSGVDYILDNNSDLVNLYDGLQTILNSYL